MTDFEQELNQFARATNGELKAASTQFSKGKKKSPITKTVRVKGREFEATEGKLQGSFRYKLDRRRGVVDRIQFRFAYHAFFIEKGLGRGRNKNRTAKPFFTPVLKNAVEKLADKTNDLYADKAVKSIFI